MTERFGQRRGELDQPDEEILVRDVLLVEGILSALELPPRHGGGMDNPVLRPPVGDRVSGHQPANNRFGGRLPHMMAWG